MDLRPPRPQSPYLLFSKRETAAAYALSSLLLLSFLFLVVLHLFTPFQPFYSLLRIAFPSAAAAAPAGHSSRCDLSQGRWVLEEEEERAPSIYYTEECPFLDRGFQCRRNGRRDTKYLHWRWQPHGCVLPRFNAADMLERSRNGRIAFVGDSIGRNQWESLVCMLASGVHNQSKIYEQYGNPITKHKGFLSMVFEGYNLTVEYYRAPFLVAIGRPPPNSPAQVRSAIHVDTMPWEFQRLAGANVLVLNAGHWWTLGKTTLVGKYFQVGKAVNMTMDVKEAFQRTIETVVQWLLRSLQPDKSYVFFRSYATSHYYNGTWNSGGGCDFATEPGTDTSTFEPEPWHSSIITDTIRSMEVGQRKVELLDITYLTNFRRDGHASRYREPGMPAGTPQDCSHWCLPGVPDTWNELLYARLLLMGYGTRKSN